MSYRWDIDEEGPREAGPAGRAGADREAAARQVAMARRRLWLALALTAVLLGAAFAGWRYWRGRRLLAQIAVDVEAAVRLEERALAEGDLELYRRQQSLSRARQLDRAPGLGGERDRRYPPQPGLGIAPSPGTVESVLPATDLPSGGPIRRATVRIRYVVSDSLGVGGFVEPRPYALSDKGRWIHTTHDRAVVEARPLSWKGQRIELRYLPADAERLEPLFARVDALLLRYCAASAACDLPAELPGARRRPAAAQASAGSPVGPARISLTGALPGRGGAMRHAEQRFLGLPAPSLTLVPADAAGEDLLVRQLVRLAILWLADEASGASYLDAFGKPIESLSNQALLLNVLIDAWLAREFDLRLPATPPLTVTPPIGADALPLWGLWLPGSRRESLELWQGFGNPSEAGADPRPERMLRDFARHLARRGDAASLARLIGALPRAEDLEAWLALGYGEAGAELLATWEIPAAPFPAERALLMRCMGNGRQATVLLRPGSRAPQTIHAALCPDAAVGDAAWQPGGGSLALTCQRGGGGSADAEILLARGPRFDAASVARVRGIGGPFVNGPLVWTADGRWLVWAEGGDETRGLRALAVSPNGEPGGVTPLPLPLAELRPISEDTAAVEAGRGQIAVAGHLPIRAAPEAAMLAYERPGGRVAVLDLDDAAAGERWQAPGQDPVWSADGRWVSVLRLTDGDAALVVLDARTGAELARADARLPELLEAA
ncbi:MAG: hypothetical protein KDH92_00005, partial [Chloroflexi bacterium]|nr:hypothetical protein [Chloroflexota bacterium]